MKIFKIIFFFSIVFINTIFSQSSVNDLLKKSNSHKFDIPKEIFIKTWGMKNIEGEGISLNVTFKNNPYKLNKDYSIMIVYDKNILYDGIFKTIGIKIQVPKTSLNLVCYFELIIYKGNKIFHFDRDQNGSFIRDTDTIMKLIFLPENDAESIYMNSLNWKEQLLIPKEFQKNIITR